ncbi:BAG family molecular chaperone regulator 2 [Neodiprion virginianus]|uniref:BAG family molecular chaperone regulator 2 n=1 Tax=Neodiprion fabricii TaxID=2872261 RepID=UPI001ED8EFD4|nr:BAG family molecular chaperone regulator 2 [Neodiprion fabricii]XP_046620696.1 BAG family molecular chaperone regulator 2 [Neodiprion virginianus]
MDSKQRDRLVSILDQVEARVEELRREAWELEEKKENLLSTLDALQNNESVFELVTEEREEIMRSVERLWVRTSTVEILIETQRNTDQEESLHKVNDLIDSLVIQLQEDPQATRERCRRFMSACTSHGPEYSEQVFESAILGCTLDDQKRIKKRLQGLLDYISKMHTI